MRSDPQRSANRVATQRKQLCQSQDYHGCPRQEADDREKQDRSNQEPAITNGTSFDLMYVNGGNWDFNDAKQYAFLRCSRTELLLIIANFDDHSVDVSVNIPSHAFDYLQIPQKRMARAKDLFSGEEEILSVVPYQPAITRLPAFTGKVLKIELI